MTVLTMLENGRLQTQDEHGRIVEIGPEHPDYHQLAATYRPSKRTIARARLVACVFILLGAGAFCLVWNEWAGFAAYRLRLCILGAACIPFGILLAICPQWGGPWGPDTPTAQKVGCAITVAVCVAVYAANDYLMKLYLP